MRTPKSTHSSSKTTLSKVFEEHYESIGRKIRSKWSGLFKLRPDVDWEDVLQSGLLLLCERINNDRHHQFDIKLIYTIVDDVAKNHYRTWKRRDALMPREVGDTCSLEEQVPDPVKRDTLLDEDIHSYLPILPEQQRLVMLEFLNGCSYQEIADRYSISKNRCYSIIYKCRSLLKIFIQSQRK